METNSSSSSSGSGSGSGSGVSDERTKVENEYRAKIQEHMQVEAK